MIIRIYLHIYIAYYHHETRQTNGGGDCGGIVATAVTVAVTSCDAIKGECGIPYCPNNTNISTTKTHLADYTKIKNKGFFESFTLLNVFIILANFLIRGFFF
jgi:hypothetical protein